MGKVDYRKYSLGELSILRQSIEKQLKMINELIKQKEKEE